MTKITALRLPQASREQLQTLAAKLGMNLTQVAMVAIDRMFHAEKVKPKATRDVAPSAAGGR